MEIPRLIECNSILQIINPIFQNEKKVLLGAPGVKTWSGKLKLYIIIIIE